MDVATVPRMTLEEFLIWEELQGARFEFDGQEPEERAGGTDRHSILKVALLSLAFVRLRGTPWAVFNSDMKIQVAGSIRYPDGFVGPRHIDASTIRHDPLVIFEVLSDSTARKDRTIKSAEYRATPSVARYVMLEQDEIAAMVFERSGEDWVGHLLMGADATLAMPEIGVTLTLGEIYEDILPAA